MYRALISFLLFIVSGVSSAQVVGPAFVPEDGFWYSPAQSGRGFAIEQQDDYLFITVYAYTDESDPARRTPIWYSAQGSWSPPRSNDSNPVYEFDSVLSRSDEGQCIGCQFTDAVTTTTNLDLAITFESPWRATMELGGESIDIERFWYSSSIYDATNTMLGQWKVIRDYTEANDDDFPFEADVLVFDERRSRNGEPYVQGYQATTGLDASGAYNEADNFYVIVVEEASDLYLAYYLYGDRFGTDRFVAAAERFQPGDDLTFRGFPVEGFRAANRSFVERELLRSKTSTKSAQSRAHVVSGSRGPGAGEPSVKAVRQQAVQSLVNELVNRMREERK